LNGTSTAHSSRLHPDCHYFRQHADIFDNHHYKEQNQGVTWIFRLDPKMFAESLDNQFIPLFDSSETDGLFLYCHMNRLPPFSHDEEAIGIKFAL